MSFSKDTFNDLQLFEDASEARSLDVSDIMLDRHLKILNHHNDLVFNDISAVEGGAPEDVDIQPERIIRIRTSRNHTSEDITLPERGGFPFLNPLRKYRNFRARTLSIIEPLSRLHPESLDIRNLNYIPRQKHPDLFVSHIPVHKHLLRYGKKHKEAIFHVSKRTAKIGIIFGIVTLSLVVFAAGLKNYIQSSTTEQYQRLFALKTLRDPIAIQQESEKIRAQFARLGVIFAPIDLAFNNSIYSNESVNLAHNIIYGGKEVAEIAALLGNLGQSLQEFAGDDTHKNIQPTISSPLLTKYSHLKLTDFLRENEDVLMTFQDHLDRAVHYYGQVKNLGNPALDAKFNQAFEALYNAQKYTHFVLTNFDQFLTILGDVKPMRYVILNQNRDEIRASGGFPGSVITVELYKGAIQKYDKKDVYYYDWHLFPYKETPPEGLNKISTNYGLRDANYYPEFEKSLEKINFFYEKAGGGSIDTLIAINQGLIIDLLTKYGSVRLKEINTDVTAENFSTLMSVLVENKLNAKISPKDILFRFSEELEKHLIEKKDFVGYIDIFLKAIEDGEVLFASSDPTVHDFIAANIPQETWKKNTGNWFYPIFTSLSGNKSDRYVKRDFETESISLSGCLVQNTIHLSSFHPFSAMEEGQITDIFKRADITDPKERERLMQIQGNSENRQYVRYIIPKGASLNSQDQDKNLMLDTTNPAYSVISFSLNTPVRQKNDITVSYTIPVPDCTSHLQFLKQPGLTHYEFRQK